LRDTQRGDDDAAVRRLDLSFRAQFVDPYQAGCMLLAWSIAATGDTPAIASANRPDFAAMAPLPR
jgi:hypothetical protein